MGFRAQMQLPMVRLHLVKPFLTGLLYPKGAVDRVLARLRLSRDMIERDDVFVSAQTMYQLVEGLCEASGDPYAGVHIGSSLDVLQWDPVARALKDAQSFGDFLLRFSIFANRDATSVTFSLQTRRDRAIFTQQRRSNFGVNTAQDDGFSIAVLCKILLLFDSGEFFEKKVIAQVSDPAVIPPNYLGLNVAGSDNHEVSLNFPAEWLLMAVNCREAIPESEAMERAPAPASARDALLRVVAHHFSDPDLTATEIAGLMGASERSLARHLAAEDTSILKELTLLRMEEARKLLINSSAPIASVATRVGYTDAGTFSRAFRRCVGQSPTEFRKEQAL